MLLTGLGHLGSPLGLGVGASPIPNAGLCHREDQSSLKGKSGSFKLEKHGRGLEAGETSVSFPVSDGLGQKCLEGCGEQVSRG